ncbi:hypothetical protein [Atopomonas sediminilitoris]|uniref:hypothetical protein n=1 Tax=Atopomonas sediminilitoris TaxID=2919919 RepID=UPI001F4E5A31|nr:hypothetical protein [Atopomonas sediminilitoris]MCJ8168376.1 hypothetical protein [Atopomonas sediminilitoris]
MRTQTLTNEKLSTTDMKAIFEEIVPSNIKDQIIKHAQWLDGSPELEQINAFNEISEIFPSWPYELKAYAYKFKEPANEIVSSLSIPEKEKRIAWFNLIKIFAILGPEHTAGQSV